MKKVTLFLSLFSFFGFVFAQQVNNQCLEIKTVKGNLLSSDPNGNLYVVDGPTLYKLNEQGTILFQYCDFLLGDIHSIDTDNPLKVMVFYDAQGKIVFLDDKLVPITESLDLVAKGYQSVTLATYSTDNTIWLYDAVLQDLVNVDFHLKELNRNHLAIDDLSPNQFFSLQEKQLVLNNPATGLLFFDAFGTYLKTLPIVSETNRSCVTATSVFYWKTSGNVGCELFAYNYKSFDNNRLTSVSAKVNDFVVAKSHLYYLDFDKRLYRIDF